MIIDTLMAGPVPAAAVHAGRMLLRDCMALQGTVAYPLAPAARSPYLWGMADPTFPEPRANRAEAIFARLAGVWRIERSIVPQGHFSGTGRFVRTDAPHVLAYREEGVTALDTGSIGGYREYRYHLAGDRIEIRFAEAYRLDQLYVSLEFADLDGAAVARDEHPCADDRYRHEMRWIDDDHFVTVITATGPTKDYSLSSDFRRLASG